MTLRWLGLIIAPALLFGLWHARIPVLAAVSSRGGESVSYAVWNHTNSIELRAVALDDGRVKALAGGAGSIHPPIPVGSPGWRGGGSPQLIDANHYVPKVARISWRLPAQTGQKESEGELIGPIPVAIRSRIPTAVLEKIKASRRYYLEIGVSAGVQPVLVRWRLIDTLPPPGQVGVREIQRGGDW